MQLGSNGRMQVRILPPALATSINVEGFIIMKNVKKVIGLTEAGTLEVEETLSPDGEHYFYEKKRLLKKKAMLEEDLADCNNLLSHFPA